MATAREYLDSVLVAAREIDRKLDAVKDAGYLADITRELQDLDERAHQVADLVAEFAK